MKKILALVLSLLIIFSLSGCGITLLLGNELLEYVNTPSTEGPQPTDPTPDKDATKPTKPLEEPQPPEGDELLPPEGDEPLPPEGDEPLPPEDNVGRYSITIWVPYQLEQQIKQQIAQFTEANPYDIVFNATIELIDTNSTASIMLADPQYGADLYFFSSTDMSRLTNNGLLDALDEDTAKLIAQSHDSIAVNIATYQDTLYAYPAAVNSGYFMYYDKTILSEENIGSLESILEICEATGRKISFELGNSWYMASFFFGTGCVSEWLQDESGNIIGLNDTFAGENGYIAAQAMQTILQSPAYRNSSFINDFDASQPSAVVISGTWSYETARSLLGDNLGIAELPSFQVNGQSYHLGSYAGYAMLGIKPQNDSDRETALHLLAQYLNSEECQMERFVEWDWTPTHLEVQASDAFQAAPHHAALITQNHYAHLQGTIHGSWWDIAKLISANIQEGMPIDMALENYQQALRDLFELDGEIKNAWTVIGNFGDSNWSTDLLMTLQSDGTWKTNEAYQLTNDSEFLIRLGRSWETMYGAYGVNEFSPITLFHMNAKPGTYYIVFDPDTEQIWLVPA